MDEASALQQIADYFQLEYTKLNPSYRLDVAFHEAGKNGRVRAYGELKIRSCTSTTYKTVFISASKFLAAKQIKDTLFPLAQVDVVFLFKFRDKTYFWMFNELEIVDPVVMGGRSDRQGNGSHGITGGDVEPMIHIPIDRMTEIPV